MKIYTKKGDAGETGLFGNIRVPKDDARIQTYGTFDELNAIIGLVIAEGELPKQTSTTLLRIQNELFQLGAELATPRGKTSGVTLIDADRIKELENEIDAMEAKLQPLKTFILPGGAKSSALLHFARTICRRAERSLISLNRADSVRAEVLQYVNRLSDHLFVCARFANASQKVNDVAWKA